MDESQTTDSHLTSAAAFVEGGIQDACDDACSICLEAFCDSDPSTVTTCKHEFHLQCILEWSQRSSQCPMCWQPISLKDPTSQELLEAVERERNFRINQPRNATIFHHPTLGDFELQHLPVGTNDAELEERIIQHLAAAAAMGRAHHLSRREGQRGRSAAQGRPQFLVFSTHPNAPQGGPASVTPGLREGTDDQAPAITAPTPVPPLAAFAEEEPSQRVLQLLPSQSEPAPASASGPSIVAANRLSVNRNSAAQSSPIHQDRAGPSEFQSFSESLKSRLNSVSMRYKESISKSTRGWKERLFSRSTSVSDIGSEVRREVNAGIASVSRMMERLETRENNARGSGETRENNARESDETRDNNARGSGPSSQRTEDASVSELYNASIIENTHASNRPNESSSTSHAAGSVSY